MAHVNSSYSKPLNANWIYTKIILCFAHRCTYFYTSISVRFRKNKDYFPKQPRKVRLCNVEAQSEGSKFLSITDEFLSLIFFHCTLSWQPLVTHHEKKLGNTRISVLTLYFKARHPRCVNNYRYIFLFQVSHTQLVIQDKIGCTFQPMAGTLIRKWLELQVGVGS
jgi:hypothetical protein